MMAPSTRVLLHCSSSRASPLFQASFYDSVDGRYVWFELNIILVFRYRSRNQTCKQTERY